MSGGETMNCHEARRHWSLYHDSEGDAELYARINEHLAECPDCARWYEHQDRVEKTIEAHLAPPPADAAMWQRLCGQVEAQPATRSARPLLFWAMAVTVAAGLLLVIGLWWRTGQNGAELTATTTDYHIRLTEGRSRTDMTSDSDLEVEAYLRQRVSFPVRCPPRKDSGFQVAGAGVEQLARTQAAYLVGTVDEAPISIFIFPREARTLFRDQAVESGSGIRGWEHGGYRLLLREFDQNLVLVIGQTDSVRLQRVLRAYGSYPHTHS